MGEGSGGMRALAASERVMMGGPPSVSALAAGRAPAAKATPRAPPATNIAATEAPTNFMHWEADTRERYPTPRGRRQGQPRDRGERAEPGRRPSGVFRAAEER